jgi:hypothetical protein
MGVEVRRVPTGWSHPTDEDGNYIPMHDLGRAAPAGKSTFGWQRTVSVWQRC